MNRSPPQASFNDGSYNARSQAGGGMSPSAISASYGNLTSDQSSHHGPSRAHPTGSSTEAKTRTKQPGPKKWSKEEDERLADILRQWGSTVHDSDWNKIAEHFKPRTGSACRSHWWTTIRKQHSELEGLNRDWKWSECEDRELVGLIYEGTRYAQRLSTSRWEMIAQNMHGRSARACKSHYYGSLAQKHPEIESRKKRR